MIKYLEKGLTYMKYFAPYTCIPKDSETKEVLKYFDDYVEQFGGHVEAGPTGYWVTIYTD